MGYNLNPIRVRLSIRFRLSEILAIDSVDQHGIRP